MVNVQPAWSLTNFYSPETAQMSASIVLYFYIGPQASYYLSGNAKVAGMSTDLNLVGLRYNTAAAVFFVRFSLFSVLKLFNALTGPIQSRGSPVVSRSNIFSFYEITFTQKHHP
jgi:hypothetical protein